MPRARKVNASARSQEVKELARALSNGSRIVLNNSSEEEEEEEEEAGKPVGYPRRVCVCLHGFAKEPERVVQLSKTANFERAVRPSTDRKRVR